MTKQYKKVLKKKEAYKRYDPRSGKKVKVPAHSQHYRVRKYQNLKKTQKNVKPTRFTNKISSTNLDPGDWLVVKSHKISIVPGEYDHCVMYCGKVKKGEKIWDRDNKEWMPEGTPYVIHSTIKKGNGLGYSRYDTIMNDINKVQALEVPHLSKSEKQQTVEYLKKQLTGGKDGKPIGPKYNILWITKRKDPKDHRGYYCSEAIWSAYMNIHNIDLDPNGFNWAKGRAWGVAPDDLLSNKESIKIKK